MEQKYFYVSFDYAAIDYENYWNYEKLRGLYDKYKIDGLFLFQEGEDLVDVYTLRKFIKRKIYFYDKYKKAEIEIECYYDEKSSMYIESKGLIELNVHDFSKKINKYPCKSYDDFFDTLDRINEEDINYKSNMNLVLLKKGIDYTK